MTICKTENCEEPTAGKSKYCRGHRAIAREVWKKNIEASKIERAQRYAEFESVALRAHVAGVKAAEACTPRHMTVGNPDTGEKWEVPQGPCGFAWVVVPGNTSFGRYAAKNLGFRKHYPKGLSLWVSAYGQSHDLKAAYAGAYAQVLADAGVKAYAGSRLD